MTKDRSYILDMGNILFCVYIPQFIHLCFKEHVDFFLILDIVNKAAVSMSMQVS